MMRWSKSLCVLTLLTLAGAATASAQTGRITGTVTDAQTGQPLPNATVTVVGTRSGGTSSENGQYSITGITAGQHQVRAQRIGFAPVTRAATVVAGQAVTVDFALTAQAVMLSEVVSIGYGSQTRRDLTGAVSTVTTDALVSAPSASVDQMLQGTTPGV